MSTENFTDIATMSSPVSVSMARDMWSTLSSCEHPREVVGEQKACATSLESMHKFVASALGTSSIHAFSTSLDVPEEGIASPLDIYKVVAVERIGGPRGGVELGLFQFLKHNKATLTYAILVRH